MIRDIVPLSAYETPTGGWRTVLVMAALWGTPMTLLLILVDDRMPLATALMIGVLTALLFGGLFTVWSRKSMARLTERLHSGDAALVPKPPSGDYGARVLASLMTSPRFAIGGHLYAGRQCIAFMPHTRNRKADRALRRLPWAEVRRVEPVVRRAPVLARILWPQPLSYVRITAESEGWLLRVPEAEHVAQELWRLRGAPEHGARSRAPGAS